MGKKRFEIGSRHSYSGLYGGRYTACVVDRTETTVTFREYWIAEDSGKECHDDRKLKIEVETLAGTDVQVEYVVVWEYRGSKGYVYCIDESEMYDLMTAGEEAVDDFDEWEDDWDEKDYGPSNPWDAPGMKVSDFITDVSYW